MRRFLWSGLLAVVASILADDSSQLALASALNAQPAVQPDLSDFNNGVGLYRQGRWNEAIESFRQFIKANPQSPRVPESQVYLGLALINQQNFTEARDVLRLFLKTYPENSNVAQARYRVAECSFLLNDFPAAKRELQAYLDQHPQDPLAPRALAYLGDVLLQLKEATAAVTVFEDARKRFPKGPLMDDIEYGLAQAYDAAGRGPESQTLFESIAANATHPHAADALLSLGNKASAAKDYAAAAKSFEALAKRYPQSPLVNASLTNRGYALFQSGRYKEASLQFAQIASELTKNRSSWTPTQRQQAASALYWQGLSDKNDAQYDRAIQAFTQAGELAGDEPLGEVVLHQQALAERAAGRSNDAKAHALALVDKWPQGEYADDSLLMAIDLSLDAPDAAETEKLISRFTKAYPESSLKWHVRLLEGRRLLETGTRTGDPALLAKSRAAFEETLKGSASLELQDQARYFLGLVLQLEGDVPGALVMIAPLVASANEQSTRPELVESLVIEMSGRLALDEFTQAAAIAQKYLQSYPKATQRRRAYALRGLALAKADQWADVEQAQIQFADEFPDDPSVAAAVMDQAEVAESAKAWNIALGYFNRLKSLAKGTVNEPFAWRGVAWSQFRLGEYKTAAAEFHELATRFPQHPLQAEALYYEGEAWLLAMDPTQALKTFRTAFDRFTPKEPAAAGDERKAPVLFGYRSGLMIARTLEQTDRFEEADKAYAALLAKFPQADVLDQILNEWALVNYEAGRFDEADKVFARLVAERPESSLADNAQLSLAESALIKADFETARKSLEELFESEKSDAAVRERALYQLIVLAMEQQRWADVTKYATEFLEKYPASPQKLQIAVSLAEAKLAADPSPETATAILPQLDELRTAIQAARAAGDLQEWHGRAWVLWAEAKLRTKSYEGIAEAAKELDDWKPPVAGRWQIREVLGRSLKQQARFDDARAAFLIVTREPTAQQTELAAKAQFLLAETYFLQENWKQAFLEYQKVYSNYAFPEWQAAGLLQAAKCDEQRGEWKEAVATYERLLREFPQVSHVAEAKQRLDSARKRI